MKDTKEVTDYADEIGIELQTRQRPLPFTKGKFVAQFRDTYHSASGMLYGVYGNGDTIDEAIKDYAEKASGKFMAVDAFSHSRQDLTFPKLVHTKLKETKDDSN